MYSVLHYGQMAADAVRMDVYARAIERAVRPGSLVVDLGAGTGIFSLLALRAGARHVHAIEPDPAIWVLGDIARENGLADRITIHPVTSYEVELAEKADVVISDLRGSLPLYGGNLAALRDAKARLLVPGGILLPERDELLVGIFENERIALALEGASKAFERLGWKAEAARRSVLNTPTRDERELHANALLTDGVRWGHVVYGTNDVAVEGEVTLPVRRRGTAHGLALWFSATVMGARAVGGAAGDGGDLGFSTEPGTSMVYSRFVLPFLEPIELALDDRVRVVVRGTEDGDRWAWEVEVVARDGQAKARLRQASFFGIPTSPDALLRASTKFVPKLSPRGERTKLALDSIDGKRSVAEIAARVTEGALAAPAAIPADTVLDDVRKLVATYGH